MVGSPPPFLAAMMMARLSLLHSLPRRASMAPFLCLIVAQCEWPDMDASSALSDPLQLPLDLRPAGVVDRSLLGAVQVAGPLPRGGRVGRLVQPGARVAEVVP